MKIKSLLTKGIPAAMLIAGAMSFSNQAFAQVKIGTNPTTLTPGAALEVEATNKGILYPRVALTSTADATTVGAHVKGMQVYNTAETSQDDGTAVTEGVYINNGLGWQLVNSNVIEDVEYGILNPPVPPCTDGKIYENNNDADDAVFGKRWKCVGNAWIPMNTPKTSGPFFQGIDRRGTLDAGNRKVMPVWRGGPIKLQPYVPGKPNPFPANLQGSTYLSSTGVIQLYRGSASGGGASITFANIESNAAKFSIQHRNDLDALTIQTRPTATGGQYPIATFSAVPNPVNANLLVSRVGIATASPATELHVKGEVFVGPEGTPGALHTGGSAIDGILLSGTGGVNVQVQNTGTGANINLSKSAAAAVNDRFITFNGNGGTPYAHIQRTATGIDFSNTSDRRLKENIKGTHLSISDLMNINVVDYNFISDKSKKQVSGFIAQELHKAYPDAVTLGGEDEKKNPWTVSYSALTPLLVKAIQDQQKEIASLKAQLEEMNSLKAEVASIKSLLEKTAEAAKSSLSK